MKITDIEHNGITYASVYDINEINDGLSFFTDESSFIQVGTWKYEKGKYLTLIIIILLIGPPPKHRKLFM